MCDTPEDLSMNGRGEAEGASVTDGGAVSRCVMPSSPGIDAGDSRGIFSYIRGSGPSMPTVHVGRDDRAYYMKHKSRGVAVIFNHQNFNPSLGMRPRSGTETDAARLSSCLQKLGYQVQVYNDLTFFDLERTVEKLYEFDHKDCDSVFVAVLTHGELGILYAQDKAYKFDTLWSGFTGDNCPSLAGKPKIFVIQACQGDKLDAGVEVRKSSVDTIQSYKIPTHADFLIAYSTIPGFYSWRNTTNGSWFIQCLCTVLSQYAASEDLLSMLTEVSRKVAFEFESNVPSDPHMHQRKQIPCITSMLTRKIFFSPN